MDVEALRAYVDQAERRVAVAESLSKRNTQLRLVEPFFSALGWSIDQIVAGYDLPGGESVDFALLIEGSPRVAVLTRACGTDLDDEDVMAITSVLTGTRIDWGILTDGQQFVFAGVDADGTVERRAMELAALPEQPDVVGRYTESAAAKRVARRRDRYHTAAHRLDENRQRIREDVVARLIETAGAAVSPAVEDAVESMLDDLLDVFHDGREETLDRTGRTHESGERDRGTGRQEKGMGVTDAGRTSDQPTETGTITDTSPDDRTGRTSGVVDQLEVPTGADDDPGTVMADADRSESNSGLVSIERDEEFVVRFFDGRSSVGAVGHRNAATATKLAVEYLLEQRHLDGTVSLPWGPTPGTTVLRHDAGDRTAITLTNGWRLDTECTLPAARRAIEALANEVGLRAMCQGDW